MLRKAPLGHALEYMEEHFLASMMLETGKEAEQQSYKEALDGCARPHTTSDDAGTLVRSTSCQAGTRMERSKYSLDDGCNIVRVAGGNAPRCCHDLHSQLVRTREELDQMMERLDDGLGQSGSGFIASLVIGLWHAGSDFVADPVECVELGPKSGPDLIVSSIVLSPAPPLMGHTKGIDIKHLTQPSLKPIS